MPAPWSWDEKAHRFPQPFTKVPGGCTRPYEVRATESHTDGRTDGRRGAAPLHSSLLSCPRPPLSLGLDPSDPSRGRRAQTSFTSAAAATGRRAAGVAPCGASTRASAPTVRCRRRRRRRC
eukprot:708961-Prymnesium_polylepis.1